MTEPTCTLRQALAHFFKIVDPPHGYFCSLQVRQDAVVYANYSEPPEGQTLACHALRGIAVEYALRHIVHLLSPDESSRDKQVEIRIGRNTEDADGIRVEIECHLTRSHQFTAFA